MAELPLFPLRTVLFPDGLLELKIFEARYLDLMSRCLREQAPVRRRRACARAARRAARGEPVQLLRGRHARRTDRGRQRAGRHPARPLPRHAALQSSARRARNATACGSPTDVDRRPTAGRADRGPGGSRQEPRRRDRGAGGARRASRFSSRTGSTTPAGSPTAGARSCRCRWKRKQRLMTLADPLARLEVVDSLMRVGTRRSDASHPRRASAWQRGRVRRRRSRVSAGACEAAPASPSASAASWRRASARLGQRGEQRRERRRRRRAREGPAHRLQVPVEVRQHVDERREQLALSPASRVATCRARRSSRTRAGSTARPRRRCAARSTSQTRVAPAQLEPDVLAPAADEAPRLDRIALLRRRRAPRRRRRAPGRAGSAARASRQTVAPRSISPCV